MSRPEIAFAFPRGHRRASILRPYHFVHPVRPWETACGLTIESASGKPLGVGDWTCQHAACRCAAARHRSTKG
jgi:hypothetical protein